jgi:hypothetical protein
MGDIPAGEEVGRDELGAAANGNVGTAEQQQVHPNRDNDLYLSRRP